MLQESGCASLHTIAAGLPAGALPPSTFRLCWSPGLRFIRRLLPRRCGFVPEYYKITVNQVLGIMGPNV
jgi:hypothetical protein